MVIFFQGQSVSSQVVSIPVTNIYKPSNIGGTSNQGMYIPASSSSQLGMSANNPPVVSIKPAETAAGDKNVVQVYYFIKNKFCWSFHLGREGNLEWKLH